MSMLELCGIDKSFFGIKALKNVAFTLEKGHILGVIGENGAGKSTLMNIIGGVIPADSGEMLLNGSRYSPRNPGDAVVAGIAFIHQELNLFTNLSVAENIHMGSFPCLPRLPFIDRKVIRSHTACLLESVNLHVSPDTPLEKLSPGERQLVEIANALSINAQIIIFDEPTTSLTTRETEKLFDLIRQLRAEGRAVIYISHILEDVHRLSDEIVVLRDGQVTCTGRTEEFTIQRMISHMVGREVDNLYPKKNIHAGSDKVLELEHVSQAGIVKDIALELHKGEILGIFGLMGSGRTELARILFGLDPYEEGRIRVKGREMKKATPRASIEHGVAFVTENRREEGLLMDVTITENIGLVSIPAFTGTLFNLVERTRMYKAAQGIINKLRIKCGAADKQPVKSLSGGNQQKVVIGKWLMAEPNILIVDEPTRGIDVGAKFEVYCILQELAAEGTGVLFISSEIEELIGTCDRILVMSRGEITGHFSRPGFDKEEILRAAFRQAAACNS